MLHGGRTGPAGYRDQREGCFRSSSRARASGCKAPCGADTLRHMAKSMRGTQLHEFAVIGARMRIDELQAEIDRIKKQFGARTLRVGSSGATGGTPPTSASSGDAEPRRRTRKLSPAGRKAISQAAKARWAKVKAEKAGMKR